MLRTVTNQSTGPNLEKLETLTIGKFINVKKNSEKENEKILSKMILLKIRNGGMS